MQEETLYGQIKDIRKQAKSDTFSFNNNKDSFSLLVRDVYNIRKNNKYRTNDTNVFEPVEENRHHHFNMIMPLVMHLARKTILKYTKKIEITDIIQAGSIGALIGIDVYYKRSKLSKQPAKLSTFVYPYIQKYINEYCYSNNSVLSSSMSKWLDATKTRVISGDDKTSNPDMPTMFESSKDSSLQTVHKDTTNFEQLYTTLFSNISKKQKKVLFLYYGVNCEKCESLRTVAKHMNISVGQAHALFNNAIAKLKSFAKENSDVLQLLDMIQNDKTIKF